MKNKTKLKILVDILMTIILILLMAFQATGQKTHEWLGMGMFVLVVIHNLFNIGWYRAIFKGKYNALRFFRTAVNFALILSMLAAMLSGMAMSRHTFLALIKINNIIQTARLMHLSSVYWCFVFMSIHLGLHWSTINTKINKLKNTAAVNVLKVIIIAVSFYGLYNFIKIDLISYMFLKNQFAFFDYGKNAVLIFLDYISFMIFFGFTAYIFFKAIILKKKL